MGIWNERLLPRFVDKALSTSDVHDVRRAACAGLRGRVLEVGYGSGLNVGHYPAAVTSVDAVEPSDTAWRLSSKRRSSVPIRIERTGLDGTRLAAADATYDAVLSTFTFCTIPDLATALVELRRVLGPGGALHFVEHGLAPEPQVARLQRSLEPLQKRIFGGCHLTRDIPLSLDTAGFEVVALDQHYLPGPRLGRPWNYVSVGRAVRRA